MKIPNHSDKLVCELIPGTTKAHWVGEKPENCVDENECSVDNGGCQHKCTNQNGSYRCECFENYEPSRDAKFDLMFVVDNSQDAQEAFEIFIYMNYRTCES